MTDVIRVDGIRGYGYHGVARVWTQAQHGMRVDLSPRHEDEGAFGRARMRHL